MSRDTSNTKRKSTNNKNSFLLQGSILALAGIVTKFIGFVYRLPMSNLLGEQGNGIYSVAYGIYNIALTLSSYSLPLAVSKLVSARLAKREYQNAWRIFQDALIFAVAAGLTACLVLFFGADALEALYARAGLAKPLRILAPTAFVVALLGVFRGYYQGKGTMMPTAFSQILEQILNAIVSVVAAWQLVRIYKGTPDQAAYGAAGGTLGTLAGAATALLFLVVVFFAYLPVIKKQNARDPAADLESHTQLYTVLLLTICPIILSQTIYQIGYTIDDLLFGNLMAAKGFADNVISSLQGVFNTQYNLLINLPVAIATAMAASTLPSIVSSGVQGDIKGRNSKIRMVVKLNMAIAFPSAAGLSLLSEPIITLLFPSLVTYRHVAVSLLWTGSCAIIFYALSTITGAILQGANHMWVPVVHSGISLAVHVGMIYGLLKYTELGVYALIIGNVTFPMLVSVLNCFAVRRKLQYRFELKKSFLWPFLASVIMGLMILMVQLLVNLLLGDMEGMDTLRHILSLCISVAIGVPVYGAVLLGMGCFSKTEMKSLPLLRRFAR